MKRNIISGVLLLLLSPSLFMACTLSDKDKSDLLNPTPEPTLEPVRTFTWEDKASPVICFEVPGGAGVKKVIMTITTNIDHPSEAFSVKQPGIASPVALTIGTPITSSGKTLSVSESPTNSGNYTFSVEQVTGTVATDEDWKLIITGFTTPNTVTVSIASQDASSVAITPSPATLFSEYGYTWMNKTSIPVYFHITGHDSDVTVYNHHITLAIDTNQTAILPSFVLKDNSGNTKTILRGDNFNWDYNANYRIQFPNLGNRNYQLDIYYNPTTLPRGYWSTAEDWTLTISGLSGTTKTDVLISATDRLNAIHEPDPVKINRPAE